MQFTLGMFIGLIVGAGGAWAFVQFLGKSAIAKARTEAEQLKANAQSEAHNRAKEIELAARQEQIKRKEEFERETVSTRNELKVHEARLAKREDTLDRKLDTLSVKEKHLDDQDARIAQRDKALKAKEEQLEDVLRQQRERLLHITNMSPEAAREMLLKRIEEECKLEAGALIQRITEQAQDEAKEKSRQIILQAIQRYAAEQTSDHTVSSVVIHSDDMKGRLIGRE